MAAQSPADGCRTATDRRIALQQVVRAVVRAMCSGP